MKRCDFCGSDQPLTITAEETLARSGGEEATICAACVWRCAERLVEHSGVRKPLSEAATHRLPTETRS